MAETEDYDKSATPLAHKTSHENGGSDEISVAGLSGLLADGQTPLAHKTSHQLGGSDAISVAGLSGLLADGQTPLGHKTSHQLGGPDAISVAGLSGLLADAQTPLLTGLTTGYIPYKPAGALANSNIFFDEINIGIGIAASIPSRLTIKGAGNTSATNALTVYNSDETGFFTIRNDGYTVFGPTIANAPAARFLIDTSTLNRGFQLYTSGALYTSTNHDFLSMYHYTDDNWALQSGDGAAYRNIVLNPLGGSVGVGKIPTTPLDVVGKIRTDVTLNAGAKTQGHYFTMNINGTDVNVLCE